MHLSNKTHITANEGQNEIRSNNSNIRVRSKSQIFELFLGFHREFENRRKIIRKWPSKRGEFERDFSKSSNFVQKTFPDISSF